MHADRQDPSGYRVGDKVRVRSGNWAETRGTISATIENMLEIATATGTIVRASADEVTNFSLAARRAWQAMPKRAGRPPSDATVRKKMVSLRIDVDVWTGLGEATERGLIPSREQAVNAWLKERLDALLEAHPHLGEMAE